MIKPQPIDERILILAPIGRDATLTGQILSRAGLCCSPCDSMPALLEKLAEGAGAALLTEEALTASARQALAEALQAQPAWSDLPIILLGKGQSRNDLGSIRQMGIEANVTQIKRPVSIPTLVTVAQSALRARRRQYEVCDLMEQLEWQNKKLEREVEERKQAQTDLQSLNETLELRVAERTVKLKATNQALRAKIKELILAEQKLDQERQLLRTLIDNMPDYIYVKDADGRFLIGNTELVRVAGAENEAEILGKTDFDIYPEKLAARYYTDDQIVLYSGRSIVDKEEPLLDPAGNWRWLSTSKVPLRDEAGQVIGLVGIGRDITPRKRAEQALRQSEERFRKIFEEGPLGMAIMDEVHQFVQVNDELCDMLEYSEAELIGHTPFELTHPDDVDASKLAMERIFFGPRSNVQLEKRFITKTNQIIWVSLTGTVIDTGEGATQLGLGMVEDITERRQIEAERLELLEALGEQHDRLRTLSARLAEVQESERRQFTRELHDKVGQNLTALNFNLGFVHANLPETLPQAKLLQARLSVAMALVTETTDRIRDVMADLRPPLLDESGLVDALKWYAERFADWAGVKVTVQAEPLEKRLPAAVENALFRIAQEALNNVAKHAQATEVTLSLRADDHAIRLKIVDDGIGFSLPASPNETKTLGWGILTMTERAEMVNGLCQIEPRPGQGVRVEVEVPRTGRTNSK